MVCELCVWLIPVEQQTSYIPQGETAEYFITSILTMSYIERQRINEAVPQPN